MDITSTSLLSIALGIGLAAATGFRVFLPLLAAAIAARAGWIPLNDSFAWLQGNAALLTLGSAAVVETLAYFIPGVDHLLDVIATPAAMIAGGIASAAVMTDVPRGLLWPLAIIAGGGIAGITKGGTALLRAKTGLVTGGLGNPVVAAGETAGAIGISVLAIVVPLLCLILVLALLVWTTRRVIRFFRSRGTSGNAPR